jgi:hypothetical protein
MLLSLKKNGFLQRGLRGLFLMAGLLLLIGLMTPRASAASVSAFAPNSGGTPATPLGNWSINANGTLGTLQITSLNNGVFYGTVLGNPIVGTYTASTGAIAFLREDTDDFSYYQIYTGTAVYGGTSMQGTFDEFYGKLAASSNPTIYTWSASLSSYLLNTPMPSPNEVYNGSANGYAFTLSVYVDSKGTLIGTIFGNPVLGYEDPNNYNFVRVEQGNFSYFQIYEGALYLTGCGQNSILQGSFASIHGPTHGYADPSAQWSATPAGQTPC